MELLYRLSLLAYPRAFRQRYGAEMIDLYRIRQRRAERRSGVRGRLAALLNALADSARSAYQERTGRSPLYAGSAGPNPNPRSRGTAMLPILLEEARHALRRLVRAPAFSLASILVLAIGIGANTTIFSVVSAIMLRPQPFAAPEQLVDVYQDSDDGDPNSSSFPAYRDIRASDRVFGDAVASANFSATLQLEDGGRSVATEIVTSNYFAVLGIPLQRGSGFTPAHDVQGGEPVTVVTDAAWRNLYAADPGIVGTTVRLNGVPLTVVGVAARDYAGTMPGLQQDFFVSLSSMGPLWGPYVGGTLDRRDDHWFMVKARLADGVTPQQAQAAMTALADRLASEYPELNQGRDITVFAPGEVRLHPEADAGLLPASAGLMTIAGLLLLLVCSNVANLFLVRATSRNEEVTLRLALGAPRGRIVTHALAESVLLSVVGGALGVAGAAFAMRAIESGGVPLPFPGSIDLRLDTQVLGYSLLLAVGAGLVFGGFPGLRIARSQATSALRGASSTASDGRAARWVRNTLVGIQVAVSFVILTLAALYSQGLANAGSVDTGIGAQEVAVLRSDASHAGYDETAGYQLFEQLRERLEALPQVESTALAMQLPVRGTGGSSTLVIEGYSPPDGTSAVEVLRSTVGPGYFETLEIPILHGRAFRSEDDGGGPGLVVSRSMAESFWGRTDVIGERIGFQSNPDLQIPIMGVVEDVKIRDLGEDPTPVFYTSLARFGTRSTYVLARSAGDASDLLRQMRTELQAIDRELPVLELTTLREHLADSLSLPRTATRALGGFGALGLLLAGVGLYAVVAFAVQRRSRELGIRIALGAGSSAVIRMVLREMLLVTAIALGAGWLIARAAAPGLAGGLIGVSGMDGSSVAVAVVLLAGTAAVAAWIPARRAVNVDPVTALREN
jgi:predicted permease